MAWPIDPGPIATITFVIMFPSSRCYRVLSSNAFFTVADANAAADVETGCCRNPRDQRGQTVERYVVPLERLAFLCDPAGAFRLMRKPTWPQDRVVEIGRLD